MQTIVIIKNIKNVPRFYP